MNAKVCSDKCFSELKRKTRKINGIEGIDYLVCKICGTHAKELASHYKRYHPTEEVPRPSKCQSARDRMKGANNPAYQHGGKLSPFSKNFIKYEGEEKRKAALKKQGQTRKKNGTNPFTREYYDSDEEFVKAQTRDLSWFIEKYGEDEGTKRHAAKTEKWIATLDSKSDEEKKRINRLKVGRCGAISKAEKEIKDALIKMNIEVNDQFQLKKNNKGWFIYDLNVNNKIIEYNGDFWHCNPKLYNSEYFNPRVKLSAADIWIKDKAKIDFAIEQGYEVFVIWEQDYKKDKQGTIDKCIKFLTQ